MARYGDNRGYYANKLRTHLVGRLGEIAAEAWLSRCLKGYRLVPAFRDLSRDKDCDIELRVSHRVARVEVKTWSEQHWPELGRCVAVGQLDALRAKAAVILWCILANGDAEVTIAGWNLLSDLDGLEPVWTGPPSRRKVHNLQMPLERLREPSTLNSEMDRLVAS